MKSEIRKDYFQNKYSIIAPKRASRPHEAEDEKTVKKTEICPFCPESIVPERIIDSIPNQKNWDVLSIKNIFPAVTADNGNAYGYQEVIIENPDHAPELADMELSQIENVLRMYAKRTAELSNDKRLSYILCFKNQGSKAGASIIHAHSQIFATELLPPEINRESKEAIIYKREKNSCPYCDIIGSETNSERLIADDGLMVAIAPIASEYFYEAWIFSKRHIDNITSLNDKEISSLAAILKKLLKKLQLLDLPFNFFVHQAISDKDQHFCLKIQPRASVWAGVELGSGLAINAIPPEEAAKFYQS